MLIYFLGGESEFLHGMNFHLFKKIGSFAQAVKRQRPELIVADLGFLGAAFDLKRFLSEQRIEAPVLYLNKSDASKSFLYKLKSSKKIPDKLFELLKILYNSPKSQSLSEIRESLVSAGIDWTANCARVSLCRLKRILQTKSACGVGLIKERDGYKLMLSPDQFVKVGI